MILIRMDRLMCDVVNAMLYDDLVPLSIFITTPGHADSVHVKPVLHCF